MAEPIDFRDYLKNAGCEKALWNILIELDKMKVKPDDPVEYIRVNLDLGLTEKFGGLKQEIEDKIAELMKIADEHPAVYSKFLKMKRKKAKKGKKGKSALNIPVRDLTERKPVGETNAQLQTINEEPALEEKSPDLVAENEEPVNSSLDTGENMHSEEKPFESISSEPMLSEQRPNEQNAPEHETKEQSVDQATVQAEAIENDSIEVDEENLAKANLTEENISDEPMSKENDTKKKWWKKLCC